MRNLLIIYNVLFLLAGNVLLSNNHYEHNHVHNHENNHLTEECQECIIINNSNIYVIDHQEINFSNNYIPYLGFQYLCLPELNIEKKNNSRAPPTA